jgi:hypothetical protein
MIQQCYTLRGGIFTRSGRGERPGRRRKWNAGLAYGNFCTVRRGAAGRKPYGLPTAPIHTKLYDHFAENGR